MEDQLKCQISPFIKYRQNQIHYSIVLRILWLSTLDQSYIYIHTETLIYIDIQTCLSIHGILENFVCTVNHLCTRLPLHRHHLYTEHGMRSQIYLFLYTYNPFKPESRLNQTYMYGPEGVRFRVCAFYCTALIYSI